MSTQRTAVPAAAIFLITAFSLPSYVSGMSTQLPAVPAAATTQTSEPITSTEVELYFLDSSGRGYSLSMDPGKVDVLLLDDGTFNIYRSGLPPRERNFTARDIKVADLVQSDPQAFKPPNIATLANPRNCAVRLRMGGQWFRVEDVRSCEQVVVYYQEKRMQSTPPFYKMSLSWPFMDALFWNASERNTYRNGMSADGRPVSRLKYADKNGNYIDNVGYTTVLSLFMPTDQARQGKFQSNTGEVCYHYESCQWSCIDQ